MSQQLVSPSSHIQLNTLLDIFPRLLFRKHEFKANLHHQHEINNNLLFPLFVRSSLKKNGNINTLLY